MIEELKVKMQKSLDSSQSSVMTIRTGRASPDLLSKLQVEYYGSFVPLNQLATVSVPEPMMLQLTIFDRSAVVFIDKAIQLSDLNLNPQTEGNIIRLRLPELTSERRADLVKVVRRYIEDGKVAIRNIRRDGIDTLKTKEKNKEISEDDLKSYQDDIQKYTDDYISKLEVLLKKKESEIMTV